MAYEEVLVALADPTRRSIYERVRRRPLTVSELTTNSAVSQPAVSQHLRVLERAKLVAQRREGTRRYYQATPEGLAELRRYLDTMWDDVLAAYAAQAKPVKRRK